MRFLPNVWSGRRPKVRHTGCQPCLCDWVPMKTLDIKAWWASLVGSALCILSHIIVGKKWLCPWLCWENNWKLRICKLPEICPMHKTSSLGWLYSVLYHCHKTLPWVWQLSVGTTNPSNELLTSGWAVFPLTPHPSKTLNIERRCDIIVEGLWSQMPWLFAWSWTSYFSEFLLTKWEKHSSVPGRVVMRNQ